MFEKLINGINIKILIWISLLFIMVSSYALWPKSISRKLKPEIAKLEICKKRSNLEEKKKETWEYVRIGNYSKAIEEADFYLKNYHRELCYQVDFLFLKAAAQLYSESYTNTYISITDAFNKIKVLENEGIIYPRLDRIYTLKGEYYLEIGVGKLALENYTRALNIASESLAIAESKNDEKSTWDFLRSKALNNLNIANVKTLTAFHPDSLEQINNYFFAAEELLSNLKKTNVDGGQEKKKNLRRLHAYFDIYYTNFLLQKIKLNYSIDKEYVLANVDSLLNQVFLVAKMDSLKRLTPQIYYLKGNAALLSENLEQAMKDFRNCLLLTKEIGINYSNYKNDIQFLYTAAYTKLLKDNYVNKLKNNNKFTYVDTAKVQELVQPINSFISKNSFLENSKAKEGFYAKAVEERDEILKLIESKLEKEEEKLTVTEKVVGALEKANRNIKYALLLSVPLYLILGYFLMNFYYKNNALEDALDQNEKKRDELRRVERKVQIKNTALANETKKLEVALQKLAKEEENVRRSKKEISHRVKNHLQILASRMKLKLREPRVIESKTASMVLEESKNIVQAVLLVHELLDKRNEKNSLPLDLYIRKLCKILLEESFGYKENVNYFVNLNLDKLKDIPVSLVVDLGVVVAEMLINVFQHAYALDEKHKVYINATVNNNQLQIAIVDKGKGMSEDELSELKKTSFGLDLAQGMIRDQHGGSWELKSIIGEGTTILVTLPFKKFIKHAS